MSVTFRILIVHVCSRVLPTPFISTELNSKQDSTRALAEGTYNHDVAESLNNLKTSSKHDALCIFADFMCAIGSGTSIMPAVTVIYQYFEAGPQADFVKFVLDTENFSSHSSLIPICYSTQSLISSQI